LSPLSSTYATLSFHKTDTIRLLHFPPALATALEPVVLASWPLGLESKSQSTAEQSAEFKCKGKPFGYYNMQHKVGGLRLVRDVLTVLHDHGWDLVTSVMCSKRYTAKDTLIFRHRQGHQGQPGNRNGAGPSVEWLVLAPMARDKLRVLYDADGVKLHGDPEDDQHRDHLGVLISGIKKTLEGLGCFDKGDWSHDSFEFQLKGKPWRSRGETSVTVRIMLMRLLELMDGYGWRLYATFVQRTGADEDKILDTWYFVRERRRTGTAELAG